MRGQDQLSRLLDEFCSLVFGILRPPASLPVPFAEEASPLGRAAASIPLAPAGARRAPQVSAAGFACLLLGVSLALMLCGSVTFMIGLILMPWVLGLVMVLHFLGILSNLSALGRSIISPASPLPKSPRKMPAMTGVYMIAKCREKTRRQKFFPGSTEPHEQIRSTFLQTSNHVGTGCDMRHLHPRLWRSSLVPSILLPRDHTEARTIPKPSAFLDMNLHILEHILLFALQPLVKPVPALFPLFVL